MKAKNILSIVSIGLLTLCIACQKGDQGDVGPAGVKGTAGQKGTDNTTVGATGDTGATGSIGATGNKGTTGASGTDGVANLVVSDWKKGTWKYISTIDGKRQYIAEVDMPEITQDILNKGLIIVYARVNGGTTGFIELNQGVSYTIDGTYKILNNGTKLGKVMLLFTDNAGFDPIDTVVGKLNSLNVEVRISALKGS